MELLAKKVLKGRSRISALRKALESVVAILGPKAPSHKGACRGCVTEMEMALQEARKALEKDHQA